MQESLSLQPRGLATAMRQVVCISDHNSERTLRCVYDIGKKKVASRTVVRAVARRLTAKDATLWIGRRPAAATVAMNASGGSPCLDYRLSAE